MFEIKQIQRVRISDQVFYQIKENVVKRVWPPGVQLPSESDLSKMFGVSRASVRTALQRLIAIEILEVRNGEGTFVKQLSSGSLLNSFIPLLVLNPQNMIDLLELRKGIEQVSCELAALRATDEEIEALSELLEGMKKGALQNEKKVYTENDFKFHIHIARMTKNPAIVKMLEIMREPLMAHIEQMPKYFDIELGIIYHTRIYESIKNRNASDAVENIRKKLQAGIDRVREAASVR